jgi:hypothetical protein
MEYMDKYLPLGSVVLLKGGQKRIMIYGRVQKEVDSDKIWDYIACLYPEGNLSEEYMYLFNHDQIDRVFALGFQDEEELEFQASLRSAQQSV